MGEVSERLALLSERDLLAELRNALVALYPVLLRLDCLEDDTQPYDDFERIAEALWDVLLCGSLAWKYGLDVPPDVGRYGFEGTGADGFIEVSGSQGAGQFVEFVGDRGLGPEPFNAVSAARGSERILFAWGPEVVARWVRGTTERAVAGGRPLD
jgi:hypothetical protein